MTETTPSHTIAGDTDTYTVQFDRLDETPLSVTIAQAVATATETSVTALEPLHYAIDADALERLFEPRANGLRSEGTVTFEYNDCLVTVAANGEVTVAPHTTE